MTILAVSPSSGWLRQRPILLYLLSALALSPGIRAQEAEEYAANQIAEGILLFTPPDMGLGNVTAVVSNGEALLVDATGTPALAQGILRELRSRGVDRVVALVSTHWHDDHIWGNQVFADSFPGLPIYAHPGTIAGVRDRATPALAGQIERLQATVAQRDSLLSLDTNADGTEMSDEQRSALDERQQLFRELVGSLETVRPTLPNTPVATGIRFDVGDLEVIVQHLGPGHSSGDLVVGVPARGVIIVGDLITRPVPAAAEASLIEWVEVLKGLEGMEWSLLVPGHGSVERDRSYLRAVRALFEEIETYVRNGVEASATVETLVANAEFGEFLAQHVGDDPRSAAMFRAFTVEPAIRSVYSRLTGGG